MIYGKKSNRRPWTVPVPLKVSSFVALHREHQKFNVKVDLSKIKSFSYDTNLRSESDLLHSDLQTNAEPVNIDLRLGSGRSGYYRKHYLKGVGRTLLAGNWNNDDLYHNSGLQLPSGAINEYFVSLFLKMVKKEHLATPCIGMLLKKLPKQHQDHVKNIFRANRRGDKNFDIIDFSFQAITVKRSDFFRFSNFVWWLDQFPQRKQGDDYFSIADFFELFNEGLKTNNQATSGSISPDQIAKQFASTTKKAILNFMESWSLGIRWGSLYNNFTMDGRMLDLETPTIFPGPIFGMISNSVLMRSKPKKLFSTRYFLMNGFEVLTYVRQIQFFLSYLRCKLEFMMQHSLFHKYEKSFVKEFLRSLSHHFKLHPATHFPYLMDIVVSTISKTLGLSIKNERQICELFLTTSSYLPYDMNKSSKKPFSTTFIPLDLPTIANSEPMFKSSIYIPEFMSDFQPTFKEVNLKFNEKVIEAGKFKDIQKLFTFIRSIEKSF